MRKLMDMQMKFGEISINKIKFDLKSRDEIPKVLIGLHISVNTSVFQMRETETFTLLSLWEPPGADPYAGWCGGWGRKTPGQSSERTD